MKFSFFVFFWASFIFISSAQAAEILARVTSVHDGDTFTAVGIHDKVKYKVRLLGVDTPEILHFEQTQGQAADDAKKFLLSLLPVGTEFTLGKETQFDKNGRVLAQIILNGTDLNFLMLKEGIGYFYFIAPFNKRILSEYSEAAKEAFFAKKGVHSGIYLGLKESYIFRMDAQGLIGKNLIGNLKSKDLFDPKEIAQIPTYERVFFLDEEQAIRAGYRRR